MNHRIALLPIVSAVALAFAAVPAGAAVRMAAPAVASDVVRVQQPQQTQQTQQQQSTPQQQKKKKPTTQQQIDQSVQSGTVPSQYRSSVPKEYQQYVPFGR